jgi:hypothetical protein
LRRDRDLKRETEVVWKKVDYIIDEILLFSSLNLQNQFQLLLYEHPLPKTTTVDSLYMITIATCVLILIDLLVA